MVPPKSAILIGFSIIFTIHFGVPLFLETPMYKIPKFKDTRPYIYELPWTLKRQRQKLVTLEQTRRIDPEVHPT